MIGIGLKKLALKHGMTVASGLAYGSLNGFATTLSEGAGYKRLDISTHFPEPGQQEKLMAAVQLTDVKREYAVQNLGIGPKAICILFNDTVGTMKRIDAFIEWFYPLLEQHGALGVDMCAHCHSEVTGGGWYLNNGAAHHLHDSCAAQVQDFFQEQAAKRAEEDTGSYAQGLLGAFLGAALGAIAWAIVLYMGYVASIIGLLIGWLAEKGYTLLRGRQGKGKVLILILAVIFGVLLGTIVPDVVTLAQMINGGELPGFAYGDIPQLILTILTENAEYRQATISNMGMGLLFAALGVFALVKKTSKEVSSPKLKKLN